MPKQRTTSGPKFGRSAGPNAAHARSAAAAATTQATAMNGTRAIESRNARSTVASSAGGAAAPGAGGGVAVSSFAMTGLLLKLLAVREPKGGRTGPALHHRSRKRAEPETRLGPRWPVRAAVAAAVELSSRSA